MVVTAGERTLSGTVVVVPCSSRDQDGKPWAVQLVTAIDGVGPSWALCDKPTTVAVSRLSPEEFTAVLALVLRRFPGPTPPSA